MLLNFLHTLRGSRLALLSFAIAVMVAVAGCGAGTPPRSQTELTSIDVTAAKHDVDDRRDTTGDGNRTL